MHVNSAKRLQKEHEKMQKEALVDGVKVSPVGEDLYHWQGTIAGPSNSPYEGGMFHLDIRPTQRYPLEPPKVKFKTSIFHPNINAQGEICLDILKSQWSPALSLMKVMLSISSLLSEPNFNDPLNACAAQLHEKSKTGYEERCRLHTQKYAVQAADDVQPTSGTKRKASSLEDSPSSPSGARTVSVASPKAKAFPKAKAASAKAKATAKAKAKAKSKK